MLGPDARKIAALNKENGIFDLTFDLTFDLVLISFSKIIYTFLKLYKLKKWLNNAEKWVWNEKR